MAANAATLLAPSARVCRWLDTDTARLLRCGAVCLLYIQVPRGNGVDAATYQVAAILDQESGQTTCYELTRIEDTGAYGETYTVEFGSGHCTCPSHQYGNGKPCKHRAALRAALRHVGVEA